MPVRYRTFHWLLDDGQPRRTFIELVAASDYDAAYMRVQDLEQALRECERQVGEDGNPWEVIPRIIARCKIPPIKPVFE